MQTANQPTNGDHLKVSDPIHDLWPTRLKWKKAFSIYVYRHKIFRSDEELRNNNKKHPINGNGW